MFQLVYNIYQLYKKRTYIKWFNVSSFFIYKIIFIVKLWINIIYINKLQWDKYLVLVIFLHRKMVKYFINNKSYTNGLKIKKTTEIAEKTR